MVVSLYVLFEYFSIILCLHYLYGEKVKLDIMTVGLGIIDVALMQFIYCGGLSQMWTILIYPLIIIYCGLKFGFNWKAIVVNNVLYLVIIACMQLGITFLLKIIFDIYEITIMQCLFINITIFLIFIFILKRVGLYTISQYLQSEERIMKIAFAITTVILLITLLRYKLIDGFDLLAYLSLVGWILLLCFITSYMRKYKYKMKEAETELKMYKLYEDSFVGLIDDIRARQHEFDNHINAIYSQHFLYNTYEELIRVQREYCDGLVKENRYNKLLTKGNPMIIGFLYGKFIEAEKQGISVSYKINIKELNCAIPVYKIVELLGNLINNAIEELIKNVDADGFFVTLEETDNRIDIEIGNECRAINYEKIQKLFEKGYSEKGENRGLGLYNVKKICDAYDIIIECFYRELESKNFLVFRLIINKKPFAG